MSLTDWDGLNRWARELKSLPCPEDGLRQDGAQVAAEDLYRFLLWGRFPRPRFPLVATPGSRKPFQDFGGDGRASRRGLSSRNSETRPRSLIRPDMIKQRISALSRYGFEPFAVIAAFVRPHSELAAFLRERIIET